MLFKLYNLINVAYSTSESLLQNCIIFCITSRLFKPHNEREILLLKDEIQNRYQNSQIHLGLEPDISIRPAQWYWGSGEAIDSHWWCGNRSRNIDTHALLKFRSSNESQPCLRKEFHYEQRKFICQQSGGMEKLTEKKENSIW